MAEKNVEMNVTRDSLGAYLWSACAFLAYVCEAYVCVAFLHIIAPCPEDFGRWRCEGRS